MTALSRRALLCSAVAVGALRLAPAAWAMETPQRRVARTVQARASRFVVGTDATGITSLSVRDDPFPTDYVYPGVALGTARIVWRHGVGDWERFDSARAVAVRTVETDAGRKASYAIADTLELQLEQPWPPQPPLLARDSNPHVAFLYRSTHFCLGHRDHLDGRRLDRHP